MTDAGPLQALLTDYTFRVVALGAAALGAVAGTLGVFAVLRRQSLLGDAISHAALPGIVLAFLLTGSKAPLVLVLGAALAGWLGTLVVMAIVGYTRIPEDSALGIVLSVFFGIGLVLLTYVQRLPTAAQAGLETFLFGRAATLLVEDVIAVAALGAGALVLVAVFWKEFKLLAFDREFGSALGLPMGSVDVLLTTLLVVAIVLGLQMVGVVLMSALVVAPAAAARQWTDSLGIMALLSAAFGAGAGVVGAVLSGAAPGVPTGPTIVLAATVIVVVSLLAAPRRGLLWRELALARRRREIRADAVLLDLWALDRQHPGEERGHPAAVLQAMSPATGVQRTLAALRERGLARSDDGGWRITAPGRAEAAAVEERGGGPNGGNDGGGAVPGEAAP
jgi:manganese/zinc/iron transport system permease protein